VHYIGNPDGGLPIDAAASLRRGPATQRMLDARGDRSEIETRIAQYADGIQNAIRRPETRRHGAPRAKRRWRTTGVQNVPRRILRVETAYWAGGCIERGVRLRSSCIIAGGPPQQT